ncbi:uncharacterized protein LOC110679512 [Aedes aegypti]|uniref:Uncharacterized protein n=1 Tax=Aedes aegypti TaxID=7159 RepID=A0A6I8U348_AEDAE|nr:uncharacterized protein LOC110679512 [Aedes aegypti]
MSLQYAENEPSLSNSSELELILDVYDDGTIQMVSTSDERLSIESPYSVSDRGSLRREPSIERLFECTELKATQSNAVLELQPSDDDEDGSDQEPELVEMCPCRCEECPTECYGRQVSKGDEMVMLAADVVIKIPIKKKNLERLMQLAKCCEDRIR